MTPDQEKEAVEGRGSVGSSCEVATRQRGVHRGNRAEAHEVPAFVL